MKRLLLLTALILLAGCHSAPTPPVAFKVPYVATDLGIPRIDNYYWLRAKESPATLDYLNAENAYTDAMMKRTQPLQDKLFTEILSHVKEDDKGVPYRKGDYMYYSRSEKGKQYEIMCRTRVGQNAEQVTLDVNELAKGQPFMDVDIYDFSPDGNLLAYSTDVTGFREYTLHIKDLSTGQLLADTVERISSCAWAADNKTLFYVVQDESKRPYRLYRHVLGAAKDDLLFEETDRAFNLGVGKTRDEKFIVAGSGSFDSSETRLLPADHPMDSFAVLYPRQPDRLYGVDHCGDQFYVLTNDAGKNNRLVRFPQAHPDQVTELIPPRPDVMLVDIDCFADHLVLTERTGGLPRLTVTDLDGKNARSITFPEPAYDVYLGMNEMFDTPALRFGYSSFINPGSVFDYDTKTGQRTVLKVREVPGGYDPDKYESRQIYATASDGTHVPLSLVFKKGTPFPAPLLLDGYGSYGISENVDFDASRLSLLDRGVICAIAHPRGGGENGKLWEDAGKLMNKKNTFTDFIACAQHLQNTGYTTPKQTVIIGGSAGGLLMGAVTNMRPDLFKAVVMQVPFVDVLDTMLDDTLPLTTQEYRQWGDPHEKPAYDYIKSYSPYDNIKPQKYPAILVETSLNDSQVMYFEPAKFTAKLRATKTDHHLLLLKCRMEEGHGGASGRYDAIHETAFDYAFILTQLGMH